MKREAVQKHLNVINAFAAGEEIQYYNSVSKEWIDVDEPGFTLVDEYRIKSKDKYKPFTLETIEPYLGDWIKYKNSKIMMMLYFVDVNYVVFYTDQETISITYRELLDKYVFLNGEPCGIKVNN